MTTWPDNKDAYETGKVIGSGGNGTVYKVEKIIFEFSLKPQHF